MESLCSFCDQICFSALGFHRPMFHPNTHLGSNNSQQFRSEPWQIARRILLSFVLDRRKTCHCCHSTLQLLDHGLKVQNTILKSLPELRAVDAELILGYCNKSALRSNLPGEDKICSEFPFGRYGSELFCCFTARG